jgi:hypothetical protein
MPAVDFPGVKLDDPPVELRNGKLVAGGEGKEDRETTRLSDHLDFVGDAGHAGQVFNGRLGKPLAIVAWDPALQKQYPLIEITRDSSDDHGGAFSQPVVRRPNNLIASGIVDGV